MSRRLVLVAAFAAAAALAFASPLRAQAPVAPLQRAAGDNAPMPYEAPFATPAGAAARAATPASLAPAPDHIGAVFTVSTLADTGAGSLRAAITSANGLPGLDQINFALPGLFPHTISLKSQLPNITSPVILDGTTQGDYTPGSPTVVLTFSGAGTANGLTIVSGGSTVRALVINGFPTNGSTTGNAIILDVAGGNVLEGNFLGINAFGTGALTNGAVGISIRGGSGFNRIGGYTADARNVIAGNGSSGLAISSGSTGHNRIAGNFFGLNAAGTAVVPNGGNNIFLSASDDTVGGLEPGARNVIAGSGTGFPDLFIGPAAPRTIVKGNYIGLNAAGTTDIGSPSNGINMRSSDNVIGDTLAAGRNVIGGTDAGSIYVFTSTALRNKIIGNFIGTDATGTVALGDLTGITLDGVTTTTIGGTTPAARNVIAGLPVVGIRIISGATGNSVLGNYVGTDVTGFTALPNGVGVEVDASAGNVVGGGAAGARNLISGNTTYGVMLNAASNNRIAGNFIGTNAAGLLDLGNGSDGVFVVGSQDTIGGPSAGNVIAFNDSAGVFIASGTGNLIQENSLHDNAGLGIDLAPRGITPNDSLDVDTGANDRVNFPFLDSLVTIPGGAKVYGHASGGANTTISVSVFKSAAYDPSHFGEGQTYLASASVALDATGYAPFVFTIPFPDPPAFLSATCRDAAGSTSEFSQAMCTVDADEDGLPDCWETQGWGVDVNSDGITDLDLYGLGARPDHHDLFVEMDAMSGYVPRRDALEMVVGAFENVGGELVFNPDQGTGIRLHYTLDDTTITAADLPDTWNQFDAIKAQSFGTQAEHESNNRFYALQAKKLVYRYGLWGRTFGTGTDTHSSGVARGPNTNGSPDFLVTLGGWDPAERGNVYVQAGAFMHELGHTLGLDHGGADTINYKPNYISVMNYTWQMPFTWLKPGTWRLDYSPVAFDTLDEQHLNETTGFGTTTGFMPEISVPFTDSLFKNHYGLLKANTPVDWSGDGVALNAQLVSDINHVGEKPPVPSPHEKLAGYADWPHLVYNFRNSEAFRSPVPMAWPAEPQLAAARDPVEMTYETYLTLNSLPPPQPAGHFVMDGVLDPSARLLASNGGLHLWAALWNGQLYVATEAAAAQGADMMFLVAGTRGALVPAPAGKAGQVAAFDAVLANTPAGNASGWSDDQARDLFAISVDTAGTVAEGVIDVHLLEEATVPNLVLAVARYATANGGALLGQVPAGNGDGNVDGLEFVDLSTIAGVVPPAAAGPRLSFASLTSNPVSGVARFGLTLGASANVEVGVFDVSGRRVASLASGTLAAGHHVLAWDTGAGRGGRRGPGVYFVRARAMGETRLLRTVVLE